MLCVRQRSGNSNLIIGIDFTKERVWTGEREGICSGKNLPFHRREFIAQQSIPKRSATDGGELLSLSLTL